MGQALALLRELRERGISVRADPPDLLVRGELDEDLRRRLKEAKPELVRQLSSAGDTFPCDRCGRFSFSTPTTCYWCRSTREATA